MNFLQEIFIRIADKLGLTMQVKPAALDRYSTHFPVNLTAAIANRIATLTMLDSDASIIGDSARAKWLSAFLREYMQDRMAVAAEVALGTGDALVKPWTDGKRIGVDIIRNEDFRVCDSIGNCLKSVIIRCDEMKKDGAVYQRFEGQKLEQWGAVPVLSIHQMVFRDGTALSSPADWPESWRQIKAEEYIPNVTQLLFGRYKCPTVNRGDINSENGVSITYGLGEVMDYAAQAYERFNAEQAKKETMIFADRTLFKADGNGKRILPEGKNKLFQTVAAKDGKELIHEFSPDMRTDQLQQGIEVNFKMLELLAGFSNGVLTAPSTNFATATEMKASLQLTYAFITKFRNQLVKGTNELLNAVDIIATRNQLTPVGAWEPKYDWSSSYIENVEEQFNRLMQAESIGAVERAEVRAWVMDEDIEMAKERVSGIAADDGYTE